MRRWRSPAEAALDVGGVRKETAIAFAPDVGELIAGLYPVMVQVQKKGGPAIGTPPTAELLESLFFGHHAGWPIHQAAAAFFAPVALGDYGVAGSQLCLAEPNVQMLLAVALLTSFAQSSLVPSGKDAWKHVAPMLPAVGPAFK